MSAANGLNDNPQQGTMIRIGTDGSWTTAPDWAAIASLNKKMANVMGRLTTVGEDAKHQQGWKYASYSAVVEVLRHAMSAEGLGLFAHLIRYIQTSEDKGIKSVVEIEFTFADGDTGATRTCRWAGEAVDFGIADKGLNKAYTAAEKYFLMRTFLVSTSDDVEPDAGEEQPLPRRRAERAIPPPRQSVAPARSQEVTEQAPEPAQKSPEPAEPETKGSSEDTEAEGKKQPLPRPLSPELLVAAIQARAKLGSRNTPSDEKRGAMNGAVEILFGSAPAETKKGLRYSVLRAFFGVDTSKNLDEGQCDAVLGWATERDPESGKWVVCHHAIREVRQLIEWRDAQMGQQKLAV